MLAKFSILKIPIILYAFFFTAYNLTLMYIFCQFMYRGIGEYKHCFLFICTIKTKNLQEPNKNSRRFNYCRKEVKRGTFLLYCGLCVKSTDYFLLFFCVGAAVGTDKNTTFKCCLCRVFVFFGSGIFRRRTVRCKKWRKKTEPNLI